MIQHLTTHGDFPRDFAYLQLKYRKLRPYHYLDQRLPNARQELDRYSERVSHPALYAGHVENPTYLTITDQTLLTVAKEGPLGGIAAYELADDLYAGHSQSGRQNHKESMFYHYLNDKHRSVSCDN